MAKSLITPAPTPVATAQVNASTHDEPRSAGVGGVVSRTCRQADVKTFCIVSPARAPQPMESDFQLKSLAVGLPTEKAIRPSVLTSTNSEDNEHLF
jgi:hypothetical protein